MLPGVFSDKVTRDIDFIEVFEAVGQCGLSFVKILLQVIVIYKWSQRHFDVNTYCTVYETSFVYSFSFSKGGKSKNTKFHCKTNIRIKYF